MDHLIEIKYKEIRLRPLQETDIEDLRNLRNELKSFFINQTFISETQQKKWFLNYLENKSDYMFVIETASLNRAGFIAAYNIDFKEKTCEFGRLMVKELAKKYTGTHSIELLLYFCFVVLQMKSVYCSVLKTNQLAKKIYERLGFIKNGSNELLDFYIYNQSSFSKINIRNEIQILKG